MPALLGILRQQQRQLLAVIGFLTKFADHLVEAVACGIQLVKINLASLLDLVEDELGQQRYRTAGGTFGIARFPGGTGDVQMRPFVVFGET